MNTNAATPDNPNGLKYSLWEYLFNKFKDQSLSFILSCIGLWAIYNMMIEKEAKSDARITVLEKRLASQEDYIRTVMFKAIQANTIVLEKVNDKIEKYEKD